MNDLEELKSLLFGAEKQALESIQERVQKPETRAVDVADVLPEAIRLSHRKGRDLVSTLRNPVGECLKESLHETPQDYADALYPVMGPAIRKSIAHTLRAFAQQINETVEQSLSAKGLKWRMEAWRAGVPFGDYLIQKTLLYRIEQAYLISRENGLLLSHVHHDVSRIKDSDAVSAMFTAIQDFVKESFSPDRSGRLETADMGDFTLWAVHGPHALLVCVIRGVPPRALRTDLSAILERIHFRYGESIRLYTGDTSSVKGVEEDLQECLRFEAQQQKEDKKRRLSIPLIILLVGIIAVFAYLGANRWFISQQEQSLIGVLNDTPGFFVSKVERVGKRFMVHGLRDPLAASVSDIADRAGIDIGQLATDLRPYQSLEPEFVYLRARNILDMPESVILSLDDEILVASGSAGQSWIDSAQLKSATGVLQMAINLDAVESMDMLQLQTDVENARLTNFYFSQDAQLDESESIRLQKHTIEVGQLADTAKRLNRLLNISVTGYTDGSGTQEMNASLADQRADAAVQALTRAGIDPGSITKSRQLTDTVGVAESALRRVDIRLSLQTPDG